MAVLTLRSCKQTTSGDLMIAVVGYNFSGAHSEIRYPKEEIRAVANGRKNLATYNNVQCPTDINRLPAQTHSVSALPKSNIPDRLSARESNSVGRSLTPRRQTFAI
jgi:hypothetical protein